MLCLAQRLPQVLNNDLESHYSTERQPPLFQAILLASALTLAQNIVSSLTWFMAIAALRELISPSLTSTTNRHSTNPVTSPLTSRYVFTSLGRPTSLANHPIVQHKRYSQKNTVSKSKK